MCVGGGWCAARCTPRGEHGRFAVCARRCPLLLLLLLLPGERRAESARTQQRDIFIKIAVRPHFKKPNSNNGADFLPFNATMLRQKSSRTALLGWSPRALRTDPFDKGNHVFHALGEPLQMKTFISYSKMRALDLFCLASAESGSRHKKTRCWMSDSQISLNLRPRWLSKSRRFYLNQVGFSYGCWNWKL